MDPGVVVTVLLLIAYLMVGHAKSVKDLSEKALNAPMWTSRPTLRVRLFLTALWPVRWRDPFATFGLRWWMAAGDLYQWAVTFGVLLLWFWLSGKMVESVLLRLGLAYLVTTLTSFLWAPIAGLLSLLLIASVGAVARSNRRSDGVDRE